MVDRLEIKVVPAYVRNKEKQEVLDSVNALQSESFKKRYPPRPMEEIAIDVGLQNRYLALFPVAVDQTTGEISLARVMAKYFEFAHIVQWRDAHRHIPIIITRYPEFIGGPFDTPGLSSFLNR